MPRRKRVLDDGDDSDSDGNSEQDFDYNNDPDAREERELFKNPYRKRRRTNGKEDAIYGVFGDDSEDEGPRRRGGGGGGTAAKRSDWAKAPAFVSGEKAFTKPEEVMQVDSDGVEDGAEKSDGSDATGDEDGGDNDGSEGEDDIREDAEQSDESEPSRPPSPRVRVPEEDEEEAPRPRFGGVGTSANAQPSFSKGGLGSSNPGLQSSFSGISRGGIGSRPTPAATVEDDDEAESTTNSRASPAAHNIPSAFTSRTAFQRASQPSAPSPAPLPASEQAHFRNIQGSFGAKMLAKMGWQAGSGLGVEGTGIATPIESKLRPQKMGIAFKGFKEKTDQSKLEAKRRGENVSEDEDEKTKKMKKKVKEAEKKRSDVWKRPKKVKTKVEHKTYEQIIAEAGEDLAPAGVGQIIDARGAVPQEVSSLSEISLNIWVPTNDPTRIPEVRHNIRLIADACKSDLDGLAREAKALQERKKFVTSEDARLRKRVEDEAELIARLQQIQLITTEISATAKEVSSLYEVSLDPFAPHFQKLILEYGKEFERYGLDEVVVGAIAPVVRRMVASWDPLSDPTFFLSVFRTWRKALRINDEEPPPDTQVDIHGARSVSTRPLQAERPMTPFESLLWNIWLPKLRTSINNDWSAEEPQPLVKLYENWFSFLPPFIRDNLLDQLILPKVQKTISDWNMKRSKVSLRAVVFPWLPHVGLRLEDLVGDARRKIKSLLRAWVADEPIPADLAAWKDLFDSGDWDTMLLKYVVPKLGATLRNDFRVNPRDQKMEPLHRVLAWSPLIRSTVFSQIVETEFFPKWLDVLHIWLIQPRVSFEEVAQWYSFWKDTFPEDVRDISGISRGFTRGLQLMNKAIELGPDAPTKLAKPDFLAEIAAASAPSRPTKDARVPRPSARTHEITFRSIVEEYAASHDLLFIPTGKAHARSRAPLYRVSRTADARKGLLVYVLDDAVWAPMPDVTNPEMEEFRAISLEDMILRATAS